MPKKHGFICRRNRERLPFASGLLEEKCAVEFLYGPSPAETTCGIPSTASSIGWEKRAGTVHRISVTGQRSNQLNYVPTRQINKMRNNQCLCGFARVDERERP